MLAFDPNNHYVENIVKTKFVLGFALSIAALCIPTAVQAQTEASAANDVCTTYYINNAAYDVADMFGANMKAALVAGLMSAVLPIGVGFASTTVNDSDRENVIKRFIESQPKKNLGIKQSVSQVDSINEFDKNCFYKIEVKRNVVKEDPRQTWFEQTLYISKTVMRETVYFKSFVYSEPVKRPYKLKPQKRFKEDKAGKYVEVINPIEDPVVQLGLFFTSLKKAEAKFVERIIKKQKIN